MHAYLKTIGFSKIKTTKELQEILRDVVENYDRKKIVETEEHHLFAEFSKEYAYDLQLRGDPCVPHTAFIFFLPQNNTLLQMLSYLPDSVVHQSANHSTNCIIEDV